MKKHQRLIPQEALPNPKERVKQAQAAEELLKQEGYIKIGLDHFALPDDPMAKSYLAGNLHRNFQGYTTDESEALIGFGPSAIGSLPNAYVQNDPAIRNYCRAIEKGEFATHKGIKLSKDDVIRKKIIERLMCDHRVNLRGVCAEFGKDLTYFSNEIAGLQEFIRDKIITFDEGVITMTHEGEALVRCVAALFDQYFRPTDSKYSKAI